jgi:hypothetical protein
MERHRMRPKLVLPLASLLLLACIGFCATSDGKAPAATPVATEEGLAVYFSPHGGYTEAVVDATDKAKQTVMVQGRHPALAGGRIGSRRHSGLVSSWTSPIIFLPGATSPVTPPR